MSRTFYLDKANTQQFLYPCEDYDTGVSTDVALAEEREDPEILEIHGPEASGCTRTFYCLFADRFRVVENLLGFAKVKTSAADATGWNGKSVHRRNPMGYDMGKGAGNPANHWVYATRAQVSPDGQKSNYYDSSSQTYRPVAQYAKIVVQFAAVDYDFVADADVLHTGSPGIGDLSCGEEWRRNCKIIQKPASQYYQYPAKGLFLVDDPAVGNKKPMTFSPSVIDNVADFWVQIYDLPYDPIQNIYSTFGNVNKFAIFQTPDNPGGQPAETLHFVAADITRKLNKTSRKYWDINLGFKKVYNRDHLGNIVGHNYLRDLVDVAGVQKLRFFRASKDGTNVTTGDNPMIELDDFRRIFWIP